MTNVVFRVCVGQERGRSIEDIAEQNVKVALGDGCYDTRCRFVGATRLSTEKADFAIPDKEERIIAPSARVVPWHVRLEK